MPFNKPSLMTFTALAVILCFDIAHKIFEANSVRLAANHQYLTSYLQFVPEPHAEEIIALENSLRTRATQYDKSIVKRHLLQGMVVNRDRKEGFIDLCDSLLFSALRYVSLVKLGYRDKAEDAWKGLLNGRKDGVWYRHPGCRHKPISRDMIVGVFAALTQNPHESLETAEGMQRYLSENKGFFSTKRSSASMVSPEIAHILAMFSGGGATMSAKSGFTTNEWEVAFTSPGYANHLIALKIWIEMELNKDKPVKFDSLTDLFIILDRQLQSQANAQRLQWVTEKLVEKNEDNLFFLYLYYRAHDLMIPKVRYALMKKLDESPYFPQKRLPKACDRNADYLWQRAVKEYQRKAETCRKEFSGIDFLWMAGLLLEDQSVAP